MTDSPEADAPLRASAHAEDALGQALASLRRAHLPPPPLDRDALLRAVLDVAALHQAVTRALGELDAMALPLVTEALRRGVEPAALAGRPYGERRLRTIARGSGLPPRRPGPAPRRAALADQTD